MASPRQTRAGRTSRSRPARGAASSLRRPPAFIQRYRGAILAAVAVLILAAAAVILVVKFGPTNAGKEAAAGVAPADPALVAAVTGIPAATYDAVGAGSASNAPKAISGAPALEEGGKPAVLYVGGEFCPFCAAERWSLLAALSRFGSFGNLHTVRSASGDVFPSTATFSFYQAAYTSQYLAFDPVEEYTNQPSGNGYTPLQQLTSAQRSTVDKYNKPPYTQGGIPFVDFGNNYAFSGATYSPGVLAGMDWQQIADQLKNPSSPQAQGIIGSANLISATICQVTGQQPADVCGSAGVQKAAATLR